MKIIVKENRELTIINNQNTQNENDIETIELTVPERYKDFVKKIVFIIGDTVIARTFENNQYIIDRDILQYEFVQFYIWLTKDSQDFRSKIKQLGINPNKSVNGEVTPAEQTEMERVIATLESEIAKVDNIDIDVNKVGNTATVTITDKDGNEKSVNILDGQNGQNGQDGKDGKDGQQGETGPAGKGIASISKTSTSGLVDTYTITYTTGNPTTYTVTNGAKRRYRSSRKRWERWTKWYKWTRWIYSSKAELIIGQHQI